MNKPVYGRKIASTIKPPPAPPPKEPTPQKPIARPSKKEPTPARLPAGAIFHAIYHDEGGRQFWSGTLTVDLDHFAGECRSVFGLMSKLDTKYRRSLEQGATP